MANILIIVTGSIAAIKVPELSSKLQEQGHNITCVLTRSAEHFVSKESLSYITGRKVYDDLFDPEDETKMDHINLSRNNDIVLVCPASADFIAKLAHGFCDDLASTLCLASNKPILVAPAMNVEMWEKKVTRRNVNLIQQDGLTLIEPAVGELACGEFGKGRLAELDDILKAVNNELSSLEAHTSHIEGGNLKGLKCLVTSGPTRENIDPVRYISNYSSGKQGYAIAESLANRGAKVYLISGPTNLKAPDGVELIPVESATDMFEASKKLLPVDFAICAAAVADWRVERYSDQKIKKKTSSFSQELKLVENPDILAEISKSGKNRPKLVIGFAAETEHLLENALVKLEKKGCDWIVANDVSDNKVFGEDNNSVHIISKNGVIEKIIDQSKNKVAEKLSDLIFDYFKNEKISFLKTN